MSYRRRPLLGEINIIPLVDVVLVLLVVFMMSAPMLTQGVEVELPKTRSAPLPAHQVEPLVISVRPDGAIFLEETRIKSSQSLVHKVQSILQNNPERPVLVRGDGAVEYERVATTLAWLYRGGVTDVGLVTEPPSEP